VLFCPGELPGGGGEMMLVEVAQGDDIAAGLGDAFEVGRTFSSDADLGDVEFFVSRITGWDAA